MHKDQPNNNAVKRLREQFRLSQAELAHRVGVSQRHLSCIETAKAKPSREMLTAILDALDPPLADRNQSFIDFGYAPQFTQRTLSDAKLAEVSEVIDLMLDKHMPYPAIVLDEDWNLVRFNAGVIQLLSLLGIDLSLLQGRPNLLQAMIAPNGLLSTVENHDEVIPYVVHRIRTEASRRKEMQTLLSAMPTEWLRPRPSGTVDAPVLVTRFRSKAGQSLAFLSTITTFGTPLDITVESLRVELFYPVNDEARAAFTGE